MAGSERTRSVKAIRDTMVAEYSMPAVNPTPLCLYRPPMSVSLFPLALSVSDLKQALWHCCQLWPYVGMGWLGTLLSRDWNAMGETAKISSHVSSTFSSRSFGRWWEHMIITSSKNPRNCMDPRNRGKSNVDKMLENIRCVFSWYDKMRWKFNAVYLSIPGSPEYILCITHSCCVTPVWTYTHRHSYTIKMKAIIELVWRCTSPPRSSELREPLGGRDQLNLDMHSEAKVK